MKINNINKKIMAGVLGGIILATPLTLTACSSYDFEHVSDTDGRLKLNSDRLYNRSDVRDLHVINVRTKINESLYLTYIEIFPGSSKFYYDVFTGQEIIREDGNGIVITEGVEILSEEDINQYLISYDMLKNSYSVEDLEYLFEKIKQDVYSDTNNKILVKDNK